VGNLEGHRHAAVVFENVSDGRRGEYRAPPTVLPGEGKRVWGGSIWFSPIFADRDAGRWALHPVFHQFISIVIPRGHCASRLNNSIEYLVGSFDVVLPNETTSNDHQAVGFGAHYSQSMQLTAEAVPGIERSYTVLRGNSASWLSVLLRPCSVEAATKSVHVEHV